MTSISISNETKTTVVNDTVQFSIGLIADVQYASSQDGSDFKKTVVRRYTNSLTLLTRTVDAWLLQPDIQGYPINLIIQLGDLLDGRCHETNQDRDVCLQSVLTQFERLPVTVPRIDVIGNHELYNFKREQLNDPNGPLRTSRQNELLNAPSTWYSMVVAPNLRVVVLDAYEISTLNGKDNNGNNVSSTTAAFDYLSQHNPNEISKKGVDWTEGLNGKEKRMVPYNGMIGEKQLNWLRQILIISMQQKQRCIVVSHVSLQQGCCSESCVVWNYPEVVEVLHNPKGDDTTPVVACFYGHAHKGGYIEDIRGIHHVTMQSPLEAIGDEVAYGTLDMYANHFVLRGEGRVPCRYLKFTTVVKTQVPELVFDDSWMTETVKHPKDGYGEYGEEEAVVEKMRQEQEGKEEKESKDDVAETAVDNVHKIEKIEKEIVDLDELDE